MTRRRVIVGLSALGILFVGIAAAAAIIAVTQTEWGRERIRGLVVAELARSVHGHVHIGRLDGNLFTNITLDSIELRGADGQPIVATGRLHAEYDLRDLLDRRILLQRLDVEHPYVRLIHRHDGSWNYRELFPPSTHRLPQTQTRGFGDYIVANGVTVHGGTFIYSNRWNPDDSLHGSRRDSVVAFTLRRPHFGLEQTAGGLMRTLSWRGIELAASSVHITDPETAGPTFQIERLDVDEFFPPFRFSHTKGRVRIVHDSLWAALSHVELPGTVGRGGGKVYWGEDRPLTLALHFDADTVSLADVRWVYANLPATGGGRASIDIRSDKTNPEIVDYMLTKMDVRTTESRVLGAMTFESGRPELIIKDVAAEGAPIDFALIRTLGGGKPFPVDWAGQWTVRARAPGGRLSRFRVDTVDLALRDAHVPDALSRLSGSGELDIAEPASTAFHRFRLSIGRLDLRTPQYVLPDFPRLHGIITGTATLDSVWNDVRFDDADVTHHDGDGAATRVTGSGRFTLGTSASSYDMDLEAMPISFTTLAQSYPSIRLRGEFSGPVSLEGTLASLDLTAQLTGEPGVLGVDGHFDLVPPGLAGSGALTLVHTDLQALFDNDSLPVTDLTLRADADVRGESLATLQGPVSATVSRSEVGRVRVDTARFVGRFADARLRVDTLSLESPAGLLTGGGGLALAAGGRDSLGLALALDSLGGWRSYLRPDEATADPLPGTVRASAALTGWVDSLAASGTLEGSVLRVGRTAARAVGVTFNLQRVRTPPRGTVGVTVDGLTVGSIALDRVALDSRFLGDGRAQVALTATTPTGPHAGAAAEVRQSLDTIDVTLDTLALYTRDNAWHLVTPAHVHHDASGLRLDQLSLRGAVSGWLTAEARLPHTGSATAHVQADSVPLGDAGQLFESSASYGGLASLDWTVAGDRKHPTMQADGQLVDAQFGDVRLEQLLAHATYADRRLQLHGDLVQRGDTTLHALVSLPIDLALEPAGKRVLEDDSLRGNISADSVQFGALATIYPSLQNPKGSFAAHIDIGGTLHHPLFDGQVRLADGEAGFPHLGVRFVGMNADLRLFGDSLLVRDLSMASVDGQHRGRATLQGSVTFREAKDPRFDLTFRASELHALSNPQLADVSISTATPLQLTGSLNRARLGGSIVVDRGAIFLPDITQKRVVSLDDPEFYNVVDTSLFQNRLLLPEPPPRLLQDLTLNDVQVALGNEVWLRSSEANINLSTSDGPLHVGTAPTGKDSTKGLALSGKLVAERGDYRLNLGIVQRTFTVERGGTMSFGGDVDINPDLDISGLYTVRQPRTNAGSGPTDLRIRVTLAGTLERPTVKLSSADSSVAYSDADLLSYLVTGQQSLSVGQASDANTIASVVIPTLGTAIGSIGSRLSGGVIDYLNIQTASIYGANGQNANLSNALLGGARIGAGKQIGRSTFISADLGVCALGGTGASGGGPPTASQIGVRLEQQLTERFSLAASSEPGTLGLYCTTGTLSRSFVTTPRQWGLDLFRSWQF